jgi:hypothetical protein
VTRFDVPATDNGSKNAIRGHKLAAKISDCWRTLSTLQRHCRIRSYLTTARTHGHHPRAAIRDASTTTAGCRHTQHDQLIRYPALAISRCVFDRHTPGFFAYCLVRLRCSR